MLHVCIHQRETRHTTCWPHLINFQSSLSELPLLHSVTAESVQPWPLHRPPQERCLVLPPGLAAYLSPSPALCSCGWAVMLWIPRSLSQRAKNRAGLWKKMSPYGQMLIRPLMWISKILVMRRVSNTPRHKNTDLCFRHQFTNCCKFVMILIQALSPPPPHLPFWLHKQKSLLPVSGLYLRGIGVQTNH